MRLIPAHTREAKDLAKRLKKALEEFGLTRDCHDFEGKPATLQQAQELLAKTLGYEGGWAELLQEVKKPHEAVYLDMLPEEESQAQSEMLVQRLSALLGFDYTHGIVWNAWVSAGIGFRPRQRRQVDENMSPWGLIYHEEEIRPGIRSVETGGHGGFILSEARQRQMPPHLGLPEPYYEEDCDWALVVLAFPDEFSRNLPGALASVDVYGSASVPRIRQNDAYEDLRTQISLNYVSPEEDPMNRPLSTEEWEVVGYLSQCVYANRRPVRCPDNEYPTLQEWVKVLSGAPRVDGTWPMGQEPWMKHWSALYQSAESMRRMIEEDERAIAALRTMLDEDNASQA